MRRASCDDQFEDCTISKCCADHGFKCIYVTGWFSQCRDSPPPPPITMAGFKVDKYKLNWEAKGSRFFKDWKFFTDDDTGGTAALPSSMLKAVRNGVIGISDEGNRAILRAGTRTGKKFKRHGIKIGTKKKWGHFLMVMRFQHLPFGCGVSPSIYTQAAGKTWPKGGGLDLLSYSNNFETFTSFHTTSKCILNEKDVNKFMQMKDAHGTDDKSEFNCHSEVCDKCTKSSSGCAPNVAPFRTGKDWAKNPGVLAVQRARGFIKVFYIPEDKIPNDLKEEAPLPEWWDQFMISYYPFAPSGDDCADDKHIMEKQRIMLSINFCGSNGSPSWADSSECRKEGPLFSKTRSRKKKKHVCRAVDPAEEHAPDEDCCTRFIDDHKGKFYTDTYLKNKAFFDIDWIKVFT